jgi:mannosyltransferase OCH1-like enzyme
MPAIPRVIHRLWIGGPEPEWMDGFAETWEQPGWTPKQWGEAEVEELLPLHNQDLYDRAEEIAGDHAIQFRSDILRYEVLFRFGGVWVDADFECLRPIDPLIEDCTAFVARVTGNWLNNAIMGAVPAHPFLFDLVVSLAENVERKLGSRPNKLSGPQFLTPVFCRHRESVRILAAQHFYPFLWDEVAEYEPGTLDPSERWPDAVACHWWANQRRLRVPA